MRIASIIALGLSLLADAITPPARAQQPVGGGRAGLREAIVALDGNGDMAIEEDEVPEAALAAFERLLKRGDANKNGKLEFDELRALGEKLRALGRGPDASPADRFRVMDSDGDGKLGKDEFLGPEPLFARIDADGDGRITRGEMTRFAAADAPTPERLKAMDKDGDGKVSRAEFKGRPAMFDRLDVDKDGYLTRDELRPGRARAKKAPEN